MRNEYRATSHVIWSIFESAFGWQEAAGGAAGYTLSQAITNGFQRSMFSNEAGMGSTPNAAAAAASWPPHPAAQGIVQMIGIFIDTLVICTASAMLILLAGNGTTYMPLEGIQLIQKAMRVLMGSWVRSLLPSWLFCLPSAPSLPTTFMPKTISSFYA
ncbi:hypothetical protein MUTS16_20360 [Escherichia coli]|nr:hypothetical protein MUTS16_20360 [Escherichia coli]